MCLHRTISNYQRPVHTKVMNSQVSQQFITSTLLTSSSTYILLPNSDNISNTWNTFESLTGKK